MKPTTPGTREFPIDPITGLDKEDLFGQVEWYQKNGLIHKNDDTQNLRNKYKKINTITTACALFALACTTSCTARQINPGAKIPIFTASRGQMADMHPMNGETPIGLTKWNNGKISIYICDDLSQEMTIKVLAHELFKHAYPLAYIENTKSAHEFLRGISAQSFDAFSCDDKERAGK